MQKDTNGGYWNPIRTSPTKGIGIGLPASTSLQLEDQLTLISPSK